MVGRYGWRLVNGIDAATRRAVHRQALVIGVATGAYGVSFGVLSVAAGLTVAQTCVLSLLMFTGASQFAVVGVLGAGGAFATAAGNALLLGARNVAYGFIAAPLLPPGRLRRALLAELVIDETVAMARAQADTAAARRAFTATGLSVYVLWNAGTLAGAVAGGSLDPARFGLDAMFPAAFLALLAPQLRQPGAVRVAVLGALVALVLVPSTPAGVPVLAAALTVLAAGVGRRHAARPTGTATADGAGPAGPDAPPEVRS